MTDQEIRNTLLRQLAARRECQQEELPLDPTIDSLEGVELLIGAEEIFGITVPDNRITSEDCGDIDRLVEIIRSVIRA